MANVHVLQIAIGIGIAIGIAIGIGIGIDCFTTEHFFGFWFQGFRVSGFLVSGFHGFIQIGVGIGIAIGIGIGIVDPRPATFDPRRSTGTPAFPTPQVAFQGFWFLVSGFQGFLQIGVGVGVAIGIDYLTTNTRDGTARVFIHRFTQITQIFLGIARVFGERQGEFLIFMKFYVFHGFLQIGVGIGIAIGIDCLTTEHFFGFWFQGFRVSGFRVSSKSGSGSGSLSESII